VESEITKLVVEYKNKNPIELIDLAQSMISIGNQYKEYVVEQRKLLPDNVKLYIKEVRKGSTIIELYPMIIGAIPVVIEHAGTVIEYADYLKTLYDWYSGKGEEKPEVTKSTLVDSIKIIEPVAKDSSAQLNIGTVQVNGDVHYHLHLDSSSANAAQNKIRRELDEQKVTEARIHEKVLMYWSNAKNDSKSNAGDKAKIESISLTPIKVIFGNDETKRKFLFDVPYPFNRGFIVDVAVETIEEKPVLYKVLKFYESIEIEK
jgi:TM2 domain-containing membrane protein YozV